MSDVRAAVAANWPEVIAGEGLARTAVEAQERAAAGAAGGCRSSRREA